MPWLDAGWMNLLDVAVNEFAVRFRCVMPWLDVAIDHMTRLVDAADELAGWCFGWFCSPQES